MRKLIDYTFYRLYYVYKMKDPAPLASARMLVVLAVTALIYFTCTLALKVVFNISILDIHPNNPKLPLMTCIFGIGGIVYWRITRKYTEKKEMRRLFDYIVYRLYNIYLTKFSIHERRFKCGWQRITPPSVI